MRIEHVALQVEDPDALVAWYTTHLGFRIIRHFPERHRTYFLGDDRDSLLEVYRHPACALPDYRRQDPLVLHLAFVSADPDADRNRLVAAGASVAEEVRPPDGSLLIMLKDPWGIALQLCRRAMPMVV